MTSVALLGSRPLSRACLKALHESDDINVKAIVTYPPDHKGWWEGSLYDLATDLGYPIVDESDLYNYKIDYLISTLYFNILEEDLINHAEDGGLNLHQAELPRYRGSNTFSHAIMNARKDDYWKYGTTLHFMTKNVDKGDIIGRKFVDITKEDTAYTLYQKIEQASIELFKNTIPDIVSGEIHNMRTPQTEYEGKKYFYNKDSLDDKKEIPSEKFCNPDTQTEVYDKVRALDFPPFEPAYTLVGENKVYLTKLAYQEILN